MRILQLNKFYYPKGGADRYMFELSELLESHGHQVIPFAMHHRNNRETPYSKYFVSNVETENPKAGISGLRTLGRMLYSSEAKKKLRKLIHHTNPDIAHVHNIYTQISPSVLDVLHAERVPVVMTIHDYHMISPSYMMWSGGRSEDLSSKSLFGLTMREFHKDSKAASFAQALAFKFHKWRKSYEMGVDVFFASTDFVANEHIEKGFPKAKMRVVPLFTPLADRIPQYHDDGYMLYFGRLVPEKGVEVLMKAMHKMPGVPMKIVGTGAEEHHLHIIGDKMPNVTFEGYKSGEALWELVAGARAVVVPSLWKEIFGLTALEAMALGKPVIASNTGGLSEVVVDRHTGFLIQPGDVQGLREAVMRLAEDPVFATMLGRAGRMRVEKYYTPEKHYKMVMDVYNELLK